MNSSHEVTILRHHHHLLPAWSSSCPRVEDLDRYGPVEDPEASLGCCTMQTALQIQVIFDEIIKIAISFTVIAVHIVLLVPHYKGICCVSRVVDFVACCMLIHDAYMMHT